MSIQITAGANISSFNNPPLSRSEQVAFPGSDFPSSAIIQHPALSKPDDGSPEASRALLGLFVLLFVVRYFRTFVGIWTWNTFQPTPVSKRPAFRASDVTAVVPSTFTDRDKLFQCVSAVLCCRPAKVFIVVSNATVENVQMCCKLEGIAKSVKVLGVNEVNKRKQMLTALRHITTPMTVFADDDVSWPDQDYLRYLLALFDDPRVGAGGTRQRARRNPSPNFWNFLGISYLERRAWNNVATNAIDGSISTLSGRTAAYRTAILKCDEFFHYFQNDSWRGTPLNSDDDKCLTRYVYSHGWKIAIQADARAVLETSLEPNRNFVNQFMRWARAHWRGNLTVMTSETYWRSRSHLWGLYVIYMSQFQTPALLVDGVLAGLLVKGLGPSACGSWRALSLLVAWMLVSKIIKLVPHFRRHPADVRFVPISLVFSYVHGVFNVYALLTLHVTHWGSQSLGNCNDPRDQDAIALPKERESQAECRETRTGEWSFS